MVCPEIQFLLVLACILEFNGCFHVFFLPCMSSVGACRRGWCCLCWPNVLCIIMCMVLLVWCGLLCVLFCVVIINGFEYRGQIVLRSFVYLVDARKKYGIFQGCSHVFLFGLFVLFASCSVYFRMSVPRLLYQNFIVIIWWRLRWVRHVVHMGAKKCNKF
jgi:hypothetical protein